MNKGRLLIIWTNLLFLVSSTLSVYKSNSTYFFEVITYFPNFIYLASLLASLIFIKNNNILYLISITFWWNIPFIIKQEIQSLLFKNFINSSLIEIHIMVILIALTLLTLFIYFFKKAPIYFIYLTFMFFAILFFETIIKPINKIDETILISKKAKYIHNDLYILLFDEYPSEETLKKFTQVKEINFIDAFLKQKGYNKFNSIYSNYLGTEKSTTSFLTARHQKGYHINKTIKALNDNIFTSNNSYKFHYFSVFDEKNRKNSLIQVHFFENINNLTTRYLIPYISSHFHAKGIGNFSDYDFYHNNAIKFLKHRLKQRHKKVVYIHFYTPHNYPKVENKTFEERIQNANKWIKLAVNTIEKKHKRAGVLIISDHGLRLKHIPKVNWNKNIMYYKNIELDTFPLVKGGLTQTLNNIKF
jgi:hypothetical protein